MAHQVETADFLTLNRKAFVLNAMGTGKTGAALWALDYLMSRGFVKRVLVVCPLSVIKVWQDEAFNILPHRTVGSMVGKKEKRLDVLNSEADICIINFDGLTSLYDTKKHKSPLDGKFDLIIVDEASTYRNAQTERYKALRHLNTLEMRLWLMTGTPTPNAPTDAWALIRLVNPNKVPASFKLFQETVMRQAGPYKWVPKPNAQAKVRELMQPAVRFEKKDCLDLPAMTYNNRHCNFTPEQAKAFDTMRKRMRHEEDGGSIVSASNAAVKIIKLQQICCGVVKDDDELPVYLSVKPRLDAVQELIEEAPDKVIVFVPFLFAMEILQAAISKYATCAVVNGKVPNHERAEIFNNFQRGPEPRVLIAHPAVAAHGLTLTAASTIIWYAPIYSSEQYEQANARIDRKGQKNEMSVYHIGSHPFEWAIYDVLKNKGSMQAALLNLYRNFAEQG
jgi:SNF2 family DNA or RNA helicase